ncbi:MAG TPA: glycosyltransferase [Acidimicrobiia bacterium]|nr:glycosyltransferase [Acidimicrobiia bacterium]
MIPPVSSNDASPPAPQLAPVRVTIALPVYNGENFIERAIESILGQTYRDFELLISDNGSTDRTREICLAFAARDARIRYFRSDVNRGAGWNYENARALARGTDYFKWAAHDDIIAPTFLERCVAALDADPEAVLAFSGVAAIDAAGDLIRLKKRQVEATSDRASERFRGVIRSNADPEAVFGLMRVNALAHTRGQGDYVASDRVLLAELAVQGTFYEVPEVLLFNRDHPSRSVRITGGDFRKLTSWFAPGKPEQFMPNWRLWREYGHAARHAPISARERMRCIALLPSFLRGHAKLLVGDLRFLVLRSRRPWRMPSGKVAAVGAPRVLIIDASDRGGIARYTAALIDDLSDRGTRVALAAPLGREREAHPISHIPWGDELAGVPAWRFKLSLVREFPRRARSLAVAVRRARPEVVHLQANVGGPFDSFLMRRWHKKGIRIVRTVHDAVAHENGRSARRDQKTWRLADVVVVHGADARAAVEAAAPETQVRVVPPDPPPMVAPRRAEARTELGLDDSPRALLLGIIRSYKGIRLLADAWPAVRAVLPEAQLSVVGSLPVPFADFDRLAGLDFVDIRLGWLTDEEMLCWSAAADVCLLPYAHGVHSAIMHNAVIAGTPVLASPPLAEEVERFQAGRVVALDAREWSDAIIDALGLHPLAAPAPPARGAQAAATAAIYEDLLAR